MRRALVVPIVVGLLALPASAQEAPYGDTYTAEELAALDRALHAGNLDRADLTFDKALTEGHGCLPAVREMLGDPLRIAAHMDSTVERHRLMAGTVENVDVMLRDAISLLEGSEYHGLSAARGRSGPLDVSDPKGLVAKLTATLAMQPTFERRGFDPEPTETVLDALRVQLPAAMAWHDVFESPFAGERQEAAAAWRKEEAAALHEAADRLDIDDLVTRWSAVLSDPGIWRSLPAAAFPREKPLVVQTQYGLVGVGTPGDDVWTGDYAALIDPGGNDRYVDCRIGAAWGTTGRRVGLFVDLGGDDVYDCGDVNITLGAAVLGIAAFYDFGAGDDRYVGGHCSIGAAMGGVAVFYDDGGTDVYEGRTFTQGAAGFGIGVFLDDSVQPKPETSSDEGTKEPVEIGLFDNDRISAWANAQAFARARGVAYCVNRRGNDTYEAGGVYLHAPLFADRYQSFSQGFAIGERGIDWAGGIAMLIDHDGNDRYLGDIYNQGVGYWYGAGLLWDGGGNDTYEMTQYGQGSGIHLAIGGLVDVAGNDTYVMHSGLGQGGSHDYAASMLHDRGGNDRYHGSTSCNGAGLTNSVGLHIEREGNDLYAARKKSGWNAGRPARDFPSIGVLVDLGGVDDYMETGTNEGTWRIRDIGLGIDLKQPDDKPSAGNTPGAGQGTGAPEMPEIVGYEGELTSEVFDDLWEIAVRWEVGDNRVIVPEARKRLIAFGKDVLPLMDGKVETDNSGLELRAFVDVLRGIADGGARDEVLAFVRRNGVEGNERRKRVALHLVAELKTAELEDVVVAILGGGDAGLARRAAGVLAKLGSHAGNETLLGWVGGADARARATAVSTLLALRADVYAALSPHLGSSDFAVRGRLVTLLARHVETYGERVVEDLRGSGNGARHTRSLLDVLARAAKSPPAGAPDAVAALLAHTDSGVRGDAARVVRAWQRTGVEMAQLAGLTATADKLATDDADPFVRAMAGSD